MERTSSPAGAPPLTARGRAPEFGALLWRSGQHRPPRQAGDGTRFVFARRTCLLTIVFLLAAMAVTTDARRAASAQPLLPVVTKCTRPARVQNISFSRTKYPHIRAHFLAALRKGWPRT